MEVIEDTRDQIVREGNHLIAIFDGWQKYTNSGNTLPVLTKEGKYKNVYEFVYNSSWNAIMPVCKKFCELDPDLFGDKERTYREKRRDLKDRVTRYDINVVYPALVQCIKWYNSLNIES